MNNNNYKKYNLRYNNLNKIKNKLIANLFRSHIGGATSSNDKLNEKLNELDTFKRNANELDTFKRNANAIEDIIIKVTTMKDGQKNIIINNHTKLLDSFNDFIKHNKLEKSKLSELLLLIDIQMIKLHIKLAIKNTSSTRSYDDTYVIDLMKTLIKINKSIDDITY